MKISIITINLNNLRGLQRTMESIFAQTSTDYEWIVIDGGSTDGSKELIEQHAEHITYWVSEPDKGIFNAMNKGIEKATGDYIQFLNSGDYLSSADVYSSFVRNRPNADVIYGNAFLVDKNGEDKGQYIAPENVRLSYFWSYRLNHQATFFHKRCFEHYRYNETNQIASDLELYMQLLYYGYSFQKWNQFVVCFETEGRGSYMSPEHVQELNAIYNRVLPPGVRVDYEEIIQNRDVDLYILIRRIIASKRWIRNLARILLWPIKLWRSSILPWMTTL